MSEDVTASASGAEEVAAEEAQLEGGNYEVIRRRLIEQGETLRAKAAALNEQRTAIFGTSTLEVLANARVRTDHNCVPCDIVMVQGCLLFGYNVFVGLKRDVAVEDVFSMQRMVDVDGSHVDFEPLGADDPASAFLRDPDFLRDFTDLYKYYRETRLRMLRALPDKLLAVFQYGQSERDIRVFRWTKLPDGSLRYVDNRGERDHTFPPTHDFDWVETRREDQVAGRHPHVSVLDEVFVETVGGDLTVKVEDNTEDGAGIYSEPVDDPNQTLDDARIEYAQIGGLILLRIRPYNEDAYRHLVFNTRTKEVVRVDAIGDSCMSLPEEQGIVFPGGYYLQTGDYKLFDERVDDLIFKRVIRSPNGEDVLYVYLHLESGRYLLLPYNLIRKSVESAIHCHGWSLFDDGRMAVFRDESSDPKKVHPMQVWRTAFTTVEHAEASPVASDSRIAKIGNADVVRGIAEAYTVCRLIDASTPTREVYEQLVSSARRLVDNVYWLGDAELGDLKATLDQIRQTAELVIDEFEKVIALQRRAQTELASAVAEQEKLLTDVRADILESVDDYMRALTRLRTQRGHLITLRDVRYVDVPRVDALEQEVVERFDAISQSCVQFLLDPESLAQLVATLEGQHAALEGITGTRELKPVLTALDEVGGGLEVLSEVVANLQVDDPAARTQILEHISEVYAQLNRVRAAAEGRKRAIASNEGKAEFVAQFALFGQSVSSALSLSDTPEKCDEQLSRLLLSLEELEGRFGEFDEFLGDLATKRDEVYEAFEAKKQLLLDARQRRIGNLLSASERMLAGIRRRAGTLDTTDALNAYFAADGLVMKLRGVAEQLESLGDSVKADELLSKLKSSKQDAMRGLRDRTELFVDGANLVRFGKHSFSVNTQRIDLTMVPRGGSGEGDAEMVFHLAGTDYYAPVESAAFQATARFWSQAIVSETDAVYRSEYLAASLLFAAESNEGLSVEALQEAARGEEGLVGLVRKAAADRYDEGYDRGVHDADAAAILAALLAMRATAGRLRYASAARSWAVWFAAEGDEAERDAWRRRAQSYARVREAFGDSAAARALAGEVAEGLSAWATGLPRLPADVPELTAPLAGEAGRYLVDEWSQEGPRYVVSGDAVRLREALRQSLDSKGLRSGFDEDLAGLAADPAAALAMALAWLEPIHKRMGESAPPALARFEAAVWLATEARADREPSQARVEAEVTGLLGQHPRIQDGALSLRLDTFLERLGAYATEHVPAYRAYRRLRAELIAEERERLRLSELEPRVMSAFVRNKLIQDVYLHLIGDNLAKQMGAAGAGKRTDLMGLLLLISPPGYGKTTLMEYIASRLGLVFVKVNGPSLGHEVVSLDPAEAPNATARQEVDKVNLALEMGNNVMLYVDDIQHTHPEFLQKFISLCDATRRIEGVWKGKTRTYDMRGKKFAVVMAGNPYTESGESFQIPDMLANRADIYNLGDVLSGRERPFALSYIENALTSNAVLAPIAARGMDDVYRVVEMAEGKDSSGELEHNLSAVELDEAVRVLRHMFAARDVLLKVNAEYIRSAAQDDAYRTEPPFKLQGSYRNMNKIAEKLVPAMNKGEVLDLISDHYIGEAQTLTTGAEQNLLKLAELRGLMSEADAARWEDIKREYGRRASMVGDADDPVARMTSALGGLGRNLDTIGDQIASAASAGAEAQARAADAQAASASAQAEALAGLLKSDASLPGWVPVLGERLEAIAEGLSRAPETDTGAVVEALTKIESRLRAQQEQHAQRLEQASGGPPHPHRAPWVRSLRPRWRSSRRRRLGTERRGSGACGRAGEARVGVCSATGAERRGSGARGRAREARSRERVGSARRHARGAEERRRERRAPRAVARQTRAGLDCVRRAARHAASRGRAAGCRLGSEHAAPSGGARTRGLGRRGRDGA